MEHSLFLHNTLSRKKEQFIPINSPHVGLYVCGPTVYSDPHLGHVRMGVVYDILYRYLLHLGYKVRYVRNITDVGHLEDELTDSGEDRITKKARLEELEPMEIVQKYKNSFQKALEQLNTLAPSIEPQASGHIIEQQQMISSILENGYAYEVNGSVYFDIEAYNKKYDYGKLSGRKVEDMLSNTRETEGQQEKKSSLDFALWKKATPEHIMRWPSEWSDGFPAWHLECSAMGTKYLGKTFDIHGGGLDLLFPHHECEIAQSAAANGIDHVKYWMHHNMITIDGEKMARSLNNFITLDELFSGSHEKLNQAYSPMTIRFFLLQAHYRSTLDFSNDALQGAEQGLIRLMRGIESMDRIKPDSTTSPAINKYKDLIDNCYAALNDDLNTTIVLPNLFEAIGLVNLLVSENKDTLPFPVSISSEDLKIFKKFMSHLVFDILGLKNEEGANKDLEDNLIKIIADLRLEARKNGDYALSDKLRDKLTENGINLKDSKAGPIWERN